MTSIYSTESQSTFMGARPDRMTVSNEYQVLAGEANVWGADVVNSYQWWYINVTRIIYLISAGHARSS